MSFCLFFCYSFIFDFDFDSSRAGTGAAQTPKPFTLCPLIKIEQYTHAQNKERPSTNTKNAKFTINASQPSNDKIFDVSAFEKFLHDRIKVDGRTGNLGETVVISQSADGGKIEVVAHQEFSGRYLKYLTKKYLKKQQLRDWLRVVSTSTGNYELRFYNVVNDDAEDDDE